MSDENKSLLGNLETVEISVKHLESGFLLKHNTYDEKGNFVHAAYIPFTEDEIHALNASGIEKIFYKKPTGQKESYPIKTLHQYLDDQVYEGPRSITSQTQKEAVDVMEKILKMVSEETESNGHFFDRAKEVVDKILKELDESNEDIINLLDIQAYDDYTYTHSLNVGVISMVFAKKLNYDNEKVKEIGLGGFLHDIGKVKVPNELINKPSELSKEEFETVKHHSKIGYDIIKNNKSLSEIVKKIVLLHHEKYDGTGYPLKLKGDDIEDIITIVSIADFYDALTTRRSYKKAFTIRETINLILKKAGIFFKSDLVHHFVNQLNKLYKESSYFKIDDYVLLNTKEIAKITDKDHDFTSRPKIEIIKNEYGRPLSKPIRIDLNLDGTRYITEVLGDSLPVEEIPIK